MTKTIHFALYFETIEQLQIRSIDAHSWSVRLTFSLIISEMAYLYITGCTLFSFWHQVAKSNRSPGDVLQNLYLEI